jgi:TolA-binding protein
MATLFEALKGLWANLTKIPKAKQEAQSPKIEVPHMKPQKQKPTHRESQQDKERSLERRIKRLTLKIQNEQDAKIVEVLTQLLFDMYEEHGDIGRRKRWVRSQPTRRDRVAHPSKSTLNAAMADLTAQYKRGEITKEVYDAAWKELQEALKLT